MLPVIPEPLTETEGIGAKRAQERIESGQEQANTFEAIAKEWLASKDWEQVTKNH